MHDTKTSTIKSSSIFFLLAFLLSWIIWIPSILFIDSEHRQVFTLAGAFGPFLAAVVTVRFIYGKEQLKKWLKETFNFKIKIIYYLAAVVLLPFGIAILHHLIFMMFGGKSGFTFDQSWYIYFISIILTALLGGGNEEPGWRAFATRELVKKIHPVTASVVVSVFWVAWHLPLYFGEGWSGSDQPLHLFFIYAIPLSIILTWLYFKCRKGIIPVMLMHAGTNIIFNYFPREGVIFESSGYDFNLIKALTYWVVALGIIWITKGRLGLNKE